MNAPQNARLLMGLISLSGLAVVAAQGMRPDVPADEPSQVVARLVYEDGTPAAGVECRLKMWPGTDPRGTSNRKGQVSIRASADDAVRFRLAVELDGIVQPEGTRAKVAPGETVYLGRILIRRTGALAGTLVDAEGRPLVGLPWSVEVRPDGRAGRRRQALTNADTGRFLIEDLPAGAFTTKASLHSENLIGPTVQVLPGQTAFTSLVFSGANPSESIRVTVRSAPFELFQGPDEGSIELIAPDGSVRTARRRYPVDPVALFADKLEYRFDELAPGSYRIEIDDPAYRPWSQDEVSPGSAIVARLSGSSTLVCKAFDAETGEGVHRFELRAKHTGEDTHYAETTIRVPGPKSQDGVLPAFEGDYEITLNAEGYSPLRLDVKELKIGERRELRFELGRPSRAEGSVTWSDGTPIPDARVSLLRPALVGDSDDTVILPFGTSSAQQEERRIEVQRVQGDTNGRFQFTGMAAGSYVAYSAQGLGIEGFTPLQIRDGEVLDDLELVLPVGGFLEGRLLPQPDVPVASVYVRVQPEHEDRRGPFHWSRERIVAARDDGTFRAGPLPPGPAVVYLSLGAPECKNGASGDEDGLIRLGTAVVSSGETLTQDFVVPVDLPGELVVTVTQGGKPAKAARVGLAGNTLEVEYETDAKGRTRPIPLLEGPWRLQVSRNGGLYVHPQPVEITSCRRAELAVEVSTFRGRCRILDAASEEPLRGALVGVMPPDVSGVGGTGGQTDGEGWVRLDLSPGVYSLTAVRTDGAWHPYEAELVWTAAGPATPAIQVRKSE